MHAWMQTRGPSHTFSDLFIHVQTPSHLFRCSPRCPSRCTSRCTLRCTPGCRGAGPQKTELLIPSDLFIIVLTFSGLLPDALLDARPDAVAWALSFLLRAFHTFSNMFMPFLTFSDFPLDASLDARLDADARALSYLFKPILTFSYLLTPFHSLSYLFRLSPRCILNARPHAEARALRYLSPTFSYILRPFSYPFSLFQTFS